MDWRRLTAISALVTLTLLQAPPADAGCGCEKPPPALASVRPAFGSPGDTVTLFAPGIVAGGSYTVSFRWGVGPNTPRVTTAATATVRRDFADGVSKPQIVVAAPALPPGPTRIVVKAGSATVLNLTAADFTMLQSPLPLGESNSVTAALCYRAAVGADGTVYFPLDISDIAQHMIFAGLAAGYPYVFGADDVTIYNTQGVIMQRLGPDQADIFDITRMSAGNSFMLTYDRHEFETYRATHQHEDGYGLDPIDPEWHTDGTRHVDHDHLVLAISGSLASGAVPQPGQTPPFGFVIATMLADGPVGPFTNNTLMWGNCY